MYGLLKYPRKIDTLLLYILLSYRNGSLSNQRKSATSFLTPGNCLLSTNTGLEASSPAIDLGPNSHGLNNTGTCLCQIVTIKSHCCTECGRCSHHNHEICFWKWNKQKKGTFTLPLVHLLLLNENGLVHLWMCVTFTLIASYARFKCFTVFVNSLSSI